MVIDGATSVSRWYSKGFRAWWAPENLHMITLYPLYRPAVLYHPLQLYDRQTPRLHIANTPTPLASPRRHPRFSPSVVAPWPRPTTRARYNNNNTRTHPRSPSVSAGVPRSLMDPARCASHHASVPRPRAGPLRPLKAARARAGQVGGRSSAVNEDDRSRTSPSARPRAVHGVPVAGAGACCRLFYCWGRGARSLVRWKGCGRSGSRSGVRRGRA